MSFIPRREMFVSGVRTDLERIDRGFLRLNANIIKRLDTLAEWTATEIAVRQRALAPVRTGALRSGIRVRPIRGRRGVRGYQTETSASTPYAEWMQWGFTYGATPKRQTAAKRRAMGSFFFHRAGRQKWEPPHRFVTEPADEVRPRYLDEAPRVLFAEVQRVQSAQYARATLRNWRASRR